MEYFSMPNHSFGSLDEIIELHRVKPQSLNPDKFISTSFAELGDFIVQTTDDVQFIQVFRNTLEGILKSMLHNFPENIFWDFDFFVRSILRQGLTSKKEYNYFFKSFQDKIELVMDLFGNQSEICFRYLHDFTYGFDWARWVNNEPQARNSIEPFSPTYLDYLLSRGQDILTSIYSNDLKYHRLPRNSYRNPFSFPREPEDETCLFKKLAKRKLIPVAAWDWNASPVWNKPFHQMREDI